MLTAVEHIMACPCCNSSNVIHFGRTHKGTKRYRCVNCNKTWSDCSKSDCPDIESLVEEYLLFESYRNLHTKYHVSTHHLNERVRTFLANTPSWEGYLDFCIDKNRESRLIHLIGLDFCCCDEDHHNKMFLALAVDAVSTLVIGFEIGTYESMDLWMYFLDRLNCRSIVCPMFISNGSKYIDEALRIVFPHSTHCTQYYRAENDRDLQTRLKFSFEMDSFLIEALASYQSIVKPQILEYSFIFKEKKMKDILLWSKNYFRERLETRINTLAIRRIEGLKKNFIERFKSFRILREDPFPLVNGWIALMMLKSLDIGFSRLSLFMQIPAITSFKQFTKKELPTTLYLEEESEEMRKFVIEIAIRGLQISNFILPK